MEKWSDHKLERISGQNEDRIYAKGQMCAIDSFDMELVTREHTCFSKNDIEMATNHIRK